ncbi:hypothetical protein V499_00761 [Pseudogymnoascus sp. VKM F-103]|nr:hypothetical protein V499_00761 [Pseudogymnoascus sp. VKM F-103]
MSNSGCDKGEGGNVEEGGNCRSYPPVARYSILYASKSPSKMSNFPNLRRLFVEARTDAEESTYSRTAFYNLVLFLSSVTVFSLAAQRVRGGKVTAP